MKKRHQIDWKHFIEECSKRGFGLADIERETGIGRKRLSGLKNNEGRDTLHSIGSHLEKFHKKKKLNFEIRYVEVTADA